MPKCLCMKSIQGDEHQRMGRMGGGEQLCGYQSVLLLNCSYCTSLFFFQDDKRKCNDLQTGCVNYFLLSGEKKCLYFYCLFAR